MSNDLILIEKHLTSPQILAKFTEVLDRGAKPYIQSVLIAVEQSEDLQKCSPDSIGIAALRAATLELSCDPALKQAHLVPYKRNKQHPDGSWYSYYEAVFQPHYLGLYTLAMRTNKYAVITVTPMPKGFDMITDLNTGNEIIVDQKREPVAFAPKVKPEEAGTWYGYFRTTRGFSKKVWMTVEQIHAHAAKHSKSYKSDKSLWKDPKHRPTMEKKTVLLELLRWADLSGISDGAMREALAAADEDLIDAPAEDVTPEPDPDALPKEWEPAQDDNPDPIDDETWSKWTRLAEKARALQIVVPNVDRGKTIKADLIEEWKLLAEKVKKAEV